MHTLEKLAKLLTTAALFLGFATCAHAQLTWTLSDVVFDNGNTATGSFTTDVGVTTFNSINVSRDRSRFGRRFHGHDRGLTPTCLA